MTFVVYVFSLQMMVKFTRRVSGHSVRLIQFHASNSAIPRRVALTRVSTIPRVSGIKTYRSPRYLSGFSSRPKHASNYSTPDNKLDGTRRDCNCNEITYRRDNH